MITERIDAVTKIPDSHLRADPPAPKSVKIEISPRCNYRCGFCALRTRKNQPTKPIDFNLFCKATREMKEAGVQEIGVFYLGESFTEPELLVDCILYLKQELNFEYVFITTNGSLSDPELVERCMAAGLDSLKFSVNAYDAEQFERIMGVKSKGFNKMLDNIAGARKVRDKGYKTGIYASSILYDYEQMPKMQQLLNDRVLPYVDAHYWLPLYSMGSFATEREKELGYTPTAGNQGRLDNLRDPLPCWSAFTEGHLTADGKLSACCFDADSNWTMGDLNEMSFMDAWHSEPFRKLRAAHLEKNVAGTVCEDCVAY